MRGIWLTRTATLALWCALAGCQSGSHMYMPQASALISGKIQVGMDRAKVIHWLGTPQKTEKYGATEFFFYDPPWQMALSAAGHIPIAITDGKVAGFGKSYYESFLKSANKS
jgi:hypothetical protein